MRRIVTAMQTQLKEMQTVDGPTDRWQRCLGCICTGDAVKSNGGCIFVGNARETNTNSVVQVRAVMTTSVIVMVVIGQQKEKLSETKHKFFLPFYRATYAQKLTNLFKSRSDTILKSEIRGR